MSMQQLMCHYQEAFRDVIITTTISVPMKNSSEIDSMTVQRRTELPRSRASFVLVTLDDVGCNDRMKCTQPSWLALLSPPGLLRLSARQGQAQVLGLTVRWNVPRSEAFGKTHESEEY